MTANVNFEKEGLGPASLREARARIAKSVRLTPLLESESLSETCGSRVALKCENLQTGGAFKTRGASHFIARLSPAERGRGVLTYSSGNHGIAVALAAKRAGIKAVVVMPESVSIVKFERVRSLGAEVHRAGTTSIERKERAEALQRERDLVMVPPFDHPWIIAGQSSCGAEILEQMSDAGTVLVPLGGGGLVSGVALACAYHRAGMRVIGVEPEGAAKMSSSLRDGAPMTLPAARSIADGLIPSRPGDLTFAICRAYVSEVVTVTDEAIREAATFLLRTEHLLVEWSGAAGVAALRSGAAQTNYTPTAVVLSGGNTDPSLILGSPGHV